MYRIPYSTNVERVALVLAHKGLDVEWIDVDPRDRTLVEELSGQPLVPVLVDGNQVIADSTAIIRHLEARQPDPPVWPREPARRAEVDVFVDWFNRVWKRPPNEIEAERSRPHPVKERIDELGAELSGSLDIFEALLDGRDYLFGEFGVADCIAFPFLRYAVDRDPDDDEPFHEILREHLILDGRCPRLEAWIARVDRRPRA
jgi:glutathione S-transferase